MSDIVERLRAHSLGAHMHPELQDDILAAIGEIKRLREALKGAAVIANHAGSEIKQLRIGRAIIAMQVGIYKPETPDFESVSVPLGILRRALNCVPPPYPEDGAAALTSQKPLSGGNENG